MTDAIAGVALPPRPETPLIGEVRFGSTVMGEVSAGKKKPASADSALAGGLTPAGGPTPTGGLTTLRSPEGARLCRLRLRASGGMGRFWLARGRSRGRAGAGE